MQLNSNLSPRFVHQPNICGTERIVLSVDVSLGSESIPVRKINKSYGKSHRKKILSLGLCVVWKLWILMHFPLHLTAILLFRSELLQDVVTLNATVNNKFVLIQEHKNVNYAEKRGRSKRAKNITLHGLNSIKAIY